MIVLSTFLICLLDMLTTHLLLTRRKSIPYCITVFVLNTLLVFGAVFLAILTIKDPGLLKLVNYSIAFLNFIYIIIVFKESLAKKLFTMYSIWVASTSILVVINSISNFFFRNAEYAYIPDLVSIIRIILQVLLLPAVYYGISKPYKKVLGVVPDKTVYFMALYPITAFFLLIHTFSSTFGHIINLATSYDNLLFILFISLGYVLVFLGISASSQTITLQYNNKIIENQLELQRQNYRTLNESIEKLYALKHDVRHHVSAMETMIKQQKYREALVYIEQFTINEQTETISTLCSNFAADSIVRYNLDLAHSKSIDIKTNLHIPEELGINPLDLCVVLGNCLENAIEACDKLEVGSPKLIEVMSEMVDAHIVFRISNSFNGRILKSSNVIQSLKDGPSHGIGLSNIIETVNKYNGNVDIRYTDDTFEITIIMCTRIPDVGNKCE